MVVNVLLVALPLLVLVGTSVFLVRDLLARRRGFAADASMPPAAVREHHGEDPVVSVTGTGRISLPDLALDRDGTPSMQTDYTPSTALTLFENDAAAEEPTGARRMVVIAASGETDRGRARAENEDAILLLPEEHVFVVADGMGGYAGGQVASRLAVEAIESTFRERRFPEEAGDARRPKRANELVWAIEEANRRIREAARASRLYEQMGATVIGVRFSERKQRAFIGHVGDSRCYRLRGGELRLLTQDHTLARYGASGALGARVRRALGLADRLSVDVLVDKPEVGDVYVLCSDGLNKMLDDESIARILAATPDDLEQGVRNLIDAANLAGGKDNVSVILVGVRSPPSPASGYWVAS